MSGISTALVNGVAGGLAGGITTGDWKDSMVDSMRNSAAGYLGGSMGGGNDALTNASSMLFRKMLGSKEDFSWDTVAKNDAICKLVGDYLNDMLMSEEQKDARAKEEQKRQEEQGKTAQGFKFMQLFENTIGGFFANVGKDLKALASDVGNAADGLKSAWGSIKSGEAWESIKTGAETAWEGVKGAASWVKDTAVSAWNGVKDTAVSTWNSVAGAVSTAAGAVGKGLSDYFAPKMIIAPEVQTAGWVQDVDYYMDNSDPDSRARADEKMESYKKIKVMVNGQEVLVNQNGVNNGGERIDQNALGLPGQNKACVFAATYKAVEIVSDSDLNTIQETYDKSEGNALDNSTNKMYVSSYNGISQNAGATDVTIDERGTWIDKNNGNVASDKVVDNNTAIKDMIQVLDNKGAIIARFNGHSVVFNGYAVQNEKLVFTVSDSGRNNNTYYDPERRQMFKYVNNERKFDKAGVNDRYIQNYTKVQKK